MRTNIAPVALPYRKLEDFLHDMSFNDAGHLADCISRIVSSGALKLPTGDEEIADSRCPDHRDVAERNDSSAVSPLPSGDSDDCQIPGQHCEFLNKVFACLQKLISADCVREAFQVLVMCQTLLTANTKRFRNTELEEQHLKVFKAIQELVGLHRVARKPRKKGCRSSKHTSICCLEPVSGNYWLWEPH